WSSDVCSSDLNRQFDLVDIVKYTPSLIGIGLDEATAIWVHKDTAEVVGNSYVAIYDHETILGKKTGGPFFFLSHGQKYDLKNREIIREPSRREREGALVSTAAH